MLTLQALFVIYQELLHKGGSYTIDFSDNCHGFPGKTSQIFYRTRDTVVKCQSYIFKKREQGVKLKFDDKGCLI